MEVIERPAAEGTQQEPTVPAASLRKIAQALKSHRRAVAVCLMESIAAWEKFAPSVESMGTDGFIAWETIPLADYLISYIENDDRGLARPLHRRAIEAAALAGGQHRADGGARTGGLHRRP